MTNAELLAKIKAEIERRIVYAIGFRDNVEQEERASFFNGEAVALKHLLPFLSTLESEKPINPEDAMKELEEKIALVKQRGTWDGVDVDKYMDEVRGREPEKPMAQDGLEKEIERYLHSLGVGYGGWVDGMEDDDLRGIARHFYDLGCRRTAEKYDEIEYNRQRAEESVPNDLKEAADDYAEQNTEEEYHTDEGIIQTYGIAYEAFIAGAEWVIENKLNKS